MMKKTSLILFFFFILSSLATEPIEFELKDFKGKAHRLKDYRGKLVVVDVWAVWCVTCRKVLPVLNELQKTFSSEDLAVIGVNVDDDSPEYVEKFSKTAGLEYLILLDRKGTVPQKYKINGVPTLFVFDERGQVLLKKEGFSGEEEKEELFNLIRRLIKGREDGEEKKLERERKKYLESLKKRES